MKNILLKLIDTYLNRCEYQNNLDNKTIKAYKIDLQQFYAFISNRDSYLKKEHIVDFIISLKKDKQYAAKTIRRKVASLKAFYNFLKYEGYIDNNPFQEIRLKYSEPLTLPKTIDMSNLNRLFSYIHTLKNNKYKSDYAREIITRDICILEILFGTGIRIGELCKLKHTDININENYIKVFGKRSKERIIPIYNDNIINSINNYAKTNLRQQSSCIFFFINNRNHPLSDQSIRNLIKKYTKDCGITAHITPHMFRHTFATSLLEDNIDIRNIQLILGHKSIITTQIYTHLTSNKKNDIMRLNNPRNKIQINNG